MKNRRLYKIIKFFLLFIILFCLIQIGREYRLSLNHKRQQSELRSSFGSSSKETIVDLNTQMKEEKKEEVVCADLQNLSMINNELVGWISIDETNIDYPVMQCENDYYLNHSFYKEEDKYGCLYVNDIADVSTPGTNFIIYGHNMKDGSMFGDLDKYKSKAFYRNHPFISFTTLSEQRTYEIMSVFQSRVYGEENVFKYYQFYQADTMEEFLYFYNHVMELSLYDTGVTAEYGDTFITLSTCDYIEKDSRFVVVAKKVE